MDYDEPEDVFEAERTTADIVYGGCMACVHGFPYKHTRERGCTFEVRNDDLTI